MLHSSHLVVIAYFAVVWMFLFTPVTQDETVSVLADTSWAIPVSHTTLHPHHF